MKSLKKGFTLIEILMGIAIVSFVIVSAFQAISQVSIMKVKLVEKAEINKNIFFSTEKLFEMIKGGGVIDYEEYFNRSQIGTDISPTTGHYKLASTFGNDGSFYKCYRINPGDGCATGTHQKYGEYTFQFIDYDSDGDGTGTDDGDGNITDDDELYGKGPDAISTNKVDELYLIDGLGKRRTYFRWNIVKDTDNPFTGTCDTSSTSNIEDNCRGNLQYIVLEGKDWGSDHNNAVVDADQYDGVVDTWIIADSFTGAKNASESVLAKDPADIEKHWTNLFPDTMNVTKAKFEIYPKKDIKLQWNNTSTDEVNISPYVRVNLKVQPSWITRQHIKGTTPKVELSTTINLNGEYFVNE